MRTIVKLDFVEKYLEVRIGREYGTNISTSFGTHSSIAFSSQLCVSLLRMFSRGYSPYVSIMFSQVTPRVEPVDH